MPSVNESLFNSFVMGGFEAACHINGQGRRLDMLAQTQHDIQAAQDYALVKSHGIQTVRDGVRWPVIETNAGVYDFSSLKPMAAAAQAQGVQVIWTLCHYGWPDDLNIFSSAFVTRFAAFSKAVALFLAPYSKEAPFFSPVNEISYFCWVAGEVGTIHPYAKGRGNEMKLQLVRAALACMDAVWEVCPKARFVHVDPLIHVAAPHHRADLRAAAAEDHATQFEAYDMIAGVRHPELGGAAKYLDIIGSNFYHENEWFYRGDYIPFYEDTPHEDWMPLHTLLEQVYERYKRPILISETSHYGDNRPAWMRMITKEIQTTLAGGIPLLGVCIYPIIDRSDWENDEHWHNSGLWDYQLGNDGRHRRILATEYAAEVQCAVRLFSQTGAEARPASTGLA